MALARYDAVADFYAAGFDTVDDPVSLALLTLLGSVSGLRGVDAGCGQGRITRELARRGAYAVGLDISGNMLSRAQAAERDQPLGVRYIHADVTRPGILGSAAFDAATCHFGLSDIDDLSGVTAAVSDALRPGGRFVFSILHPCFAGGHGIAGSWPATGRYYDEGRWTAQDARSTLRRQVGSTHRTLSTYLNTLRAHGLWVDHVAEPVPAADWDETHQADSQPVYLVVRSVKGIR